MNWNLIKLKVICVFDFNYEWDDVDSEGWCIKSSKVVKDEVVEVVLYENKNDSKLNYYRINDNPAEIEEKVFKKYFNKVA